MDSGFPPEELKKFSEAGRAIAAAANTSVELWARSEAGVILKAWAGKTKVAKDANLTRSGIIRAYRQARRAAGYGSDAKKSKTGPGQASINLGFRGGPSGRVYYRTRNRGTLGGSSGFQTPMKGSPANMRIDSRDWPAVSAFVSNFQQIAEPLVEAARKSAGLSRQMVVQIADDLGIKLETVKGGGVSAVGVAKARSAMASNGQYYRNGYGIISDTATDFYITLVGRPPKPGVATWMDQSLRLVISGRMRYFRRNLEEGVFLSLEKTAKAYPYLTVLKSAA